MNKFFVIIIYLLIQSCSYPKSVLICGDHVCVNKKEANQYFEENLTLEVKIINKDDKNKIDLIELNLRQNNNDKKSITMKTKDKTNKKIKSLTPKEIKKIKSKIRKQEQEKKLISKKIINKKSSKKKIKFNDSELKKKNKNVDNVINEDLVDVCTIIKKCSIDEISKYLNKKDKKKKYPNISIRQ